MMQAMSYQEYTKLGWIQPPKPRHNKFFTDEHQHAKHKALYNIKQGFPPKSGAADPTWLQQWISEMGPYLYHGTTNTASKRILREGLYPQDDVHPSDFYNPRPNHVYMGTRKYVNQCGYNNGIGREPRTTLKIDLRKLDPRHFNPDEDHFSLGSINMDPWADTSNSIVKRVHELYPPPDSEEYYPGESQTLGDWADQAHLGQDPEETHYSMSMGSVAHEGHIPPDAISIARPTPKLAWGEPGMRPPDGHQLWWKPGTPGRGFIEPSGRVHTWPEEEGTHVQMAHAKGIKQVPTTFMLRPTGEVVPVMPFVPRERALVTGLGFPVSTDRYDDVGPAERYAKTDANHWEGKMWHGNEKGLVGFVRTPFWTTSHKPEALGFGDTVHPISVRFKNPAFYFGERTPGDIEMAQKAGNDGIVIKYPEDNKDPSDPYPERTWAIAMDPGTIVPGHDHEWPYS